MEGVRIPASYDGIVFAIRTRTKTNDTQRRIKQASLILRPYVLRDASGFPFRLDTIRGAKHTSKLAFAQTNALLAEILRTNASSGGRDVKISTSKNSDMPCSLGVALGPTGPNA